MTIIANVLGDSLIPPPCPVSVPPPQVVLNGALGTANMASQVTSSTLGRLFGGPRAVKQHQNITGVYTFVLAHRVSLLPNHTPQFLARRAAKRNRVKAKQALDDATRDSARSPKGEQNEQTEEVRPFLICIARAVNLSWSGLGPWYR